MTSYLQVSTTTPTRDDAVRLSGAAVKAGLAASAQIHGPVSTVFWHEGEYTEGQEWQVTFKTTEARYDELEDYLLDSHPWNNAEVTATAIVTGAADYLTWIDRSTQPR